MWLVGWARCCEHPVLPMLKHRLQGVSAEVCREPVAFCSKWSHVRMQHLQNCWCSMFCLRLCSSWCVALLHMCRSLLVHVQSRMIHADASMQSQMTHADAIMHAMMAVSLGACSCMHAVSDDTCRSNHPCNNGSLTWFMQLHACSLR